MAERDLVEKVKAELKRRGAYCVKISPPVEAGTPDILACYRGMFVGLECKQKHGRLSAIQAHRADQIGAAGGWAFVIRSMEDLHDALGVLDRAGDPGGRRTGLAR